MTPAYLPARRRPRRISSLLHGGDRVLASLRWCEAVLDGAHGGAPRDAATIGACMAELAAVARSGALRQLPCVRRPEDHRQLRVHLVASLLAPRCAAGSAPELARLLRGLESADGLSLRELSLVPAMLRLSAIESLARGEMEATDAAALIERCAAIDPSALVEELAQDAPAEAALRTDAAGLYTSCDLATRDAYRAAAAQLARWSSRTEADVARHAASLAHHAAAADGADAVSAHVGFHLVGEGRARLEREIGARPPAMVRLGRAARRRAVGLYLAAGSSMAAVMTAALLLAQRSHEPSVAAWTALALVAALPAFAAFWQLAHVVIDTLYSLTASRPPLPRMDFERAIPDRFATLVVVPCMIRSQADADSLARVLQEHAASAARPELRFCLLSDFGDAACEVMPEDRELLAHARARIDELNGPDRGTPRRRFLLLHRPRRWNAAEGVWMGHERKRGKLCDLNALITGAGAAAFMPTADAELVAGVRFVITLDVDNRMAKGAALRLIETMAHPLNRARVSRRGGGTRRTLCGYGVLQPRICSRPLSDRLSRYEGWGADELGTDEPQEKLCHLQQDVFGEASYFGKGIYDVSAFARTTAGRFDENTILSHDLVEGACARTAWIADACLMEDSAGDYRTDALRRHRWMRGDWQNLMWMMRRAATGARDLSLLSRWKIAENVRRNLVPVSMFWLLAAGFLLAPDPAPWTAGVLAVAIVPRVVWFAGEWGRWWQRVIAGRIGALDFAAVSLQIAHGWALRSVFIAATLPFEALLAADAAARSSWRLLFSRRGLLEWRPFGGSSRHALSGAATPASYVVMMRSQLVATLLLSLLVGVARPHALMVASPLMLAWLVAPALAWFISQPREDAGGFSVMKMMAERIDR